MESQVFKRDESSVKVVPTFLIPLVAFTTLIMFILFVIAIVFCFKHSYTKAGIFGGVALVLFIFGKFCDTLEWHRNVTYEFKDGKLFYTYDLDGNVIPTSSSTVTVVVNSIREIKAKRHHILIKGDIVKKHPLAHDKHVGKFDLSDVTGSHDEIMKCLEQLRA